MVERGHHRLYPDDGLDVLSLFRDVMEDRRATSGNKLMSRVHDALRRAEQSALSSEESAAVLAPTEEIIAAPETAGRLRPTQRLPCCGSISIPACCRTSRSFLFSPRRNPTCWI